MCTYVARSTETEVPAVWRASPSTARLTRCPWSNSCSTKCFATQTCEGRPDAVPVRSAQALRRRAPAARSGDPWRWLERTRRSRQARATETLALVAVTGTTWPAS